jgi:hypothetical protein
LPGAFRQGDGMHTQTVLKSHAEGPKSPPEHEMGARHERPGIRF